MQHPRESLLALNEKFCWNEKPIIPYCKVIPLQLSGLALSSPLDFLTGHVTSPGVSEHVSYDDPTKNSVCKNHWSLKLGMLSAIKVTKMWEK